MAIVARKGTTYPVCPGGSHVGLCVDVVDMGMVKSTYSGKTKTQHKIRIIWQVAELREDGKPFQVSKRYTNSLHEKATLRKDLESWRGVPFTDSQLDGWDVEGVIGAGAMLSVVQNAQNGSVYANVAAIMRPPKGMALPAVDPSYVRVQDRPKDDPGGVNGADAPDQPDWNPSDDDVPF
jgi:hypothetical protein